MLPETVAECGSRKFPGTPHCSWWSSNNKIRHARDEGGTTRRREEDEEIKGIHNNTDYYNSKENSTTAFLFTAARWEQEVEVADSSPKLTFTFRSSYD